MVIKIKPAVRRMATKAKAWPKRANAVWSFDPEAPDSHIGCTGEDLIACYKFQQLAQDPF